MINKGIGTLMCASGLLLSLSANAATVELVAPSPITGAVMNEPAYPSAQGNYAAFTNLQNIALGSDVAVSGTIAGFSAIHDAAFLTDGNYGNGRSWIGNGANSFLTVDLGSVRSFSALAFGRDRLGVFDDRNSGQFSIFTSDDNITFTQILDSSMFGYDGNTVPGMSVLASFGDTQARYVKLQLTSSGAGVDEVEILSSVPVPAAAWLFGSGLIALAGFARQKKHSGAI